MEKISVIIPTYKRPESALKLLGDLELQNATTFKVEALFVSNLPDQELESKLSETYCSESFKASYLCSHEVGVNRARNLGAQSASGDVLLFLDDDCRLTDRDFLSKTIKNHKKYDSAIAIGGFYKAPKKQGALEKAYHTNAQDWLESSIYQDNKSRQLIGGNMSFKAHVLKNKIRFNEKIRFGGSETELFARLSNAGEEIRLIHDLDVVHESPIGPIEFLRKAFMQGMGRSQIKNPANNKASTPTATSTLQSSLLAVYSFFFLWGFYYASSANKQTRFKNLLRGFKLTFSGAPEEMLDEAATATIEHHKLRLPLFFNAKSLFHWSKGNLWKFFAFFTAPFHWTKLKIWPQLIRAFYIGKKQAWNFRWLITRPYHYSKLILVPPLIVCYHWARQYLLPPAKVVYYAAFYVVSRPYHWTKQFIRPLAIAITNIVSFILTRPYHWTKSLLAPVVISIFHFINRSVYPACKYVLTRPYHLLKQYIYPCARYIISLPYHLFKANAWRVGVFFTRLKSQLWRVKAFVYMPYHFARLNAWKLKKLYYYFVYKSLIFFPFRKTYYFTHYQLSKLGFFKKE